tara:strand:+ start:205 stop:1311 length:1107 start_codon:yes stop_codon:yes gene_type:complete
MKIFNKKALGLKWIALAITIIMSIGAVLYLAAQYDIPQVGEYSFNMLRTFEKNSRVPVIIEDIAEGINENTIDNFDNNKVFGLRSYCENLSYKDKIKDANFIDANGKLGIPGKTRNCFVDEDDLMELFNETFEKTLNAFYFGDLNLEISNAEYVSYVEKETEYSNIVNAIVEIPITMRDYTDKKRIGKFSMGSNFKLPVDYDFDDSIKEVCILSADCGADCNDVMAKYPLEDYRTKEYSCNEYFSCLDAPADDFGNYYPCLNEGGDQIPFCKGECPDCSCGEWYNVESCAQQGVPQNILQERVCKHTDITICPLPREQTIYDCCGYSYEACDCNIGEECCTEDASLCPLPDEDEGTEEESDGDVLVQG